MIRKGKKTQTMMMERTVPLLIFKISEIFFVPILSQICSSDTATRTFPRPIRSSAIFLYKFSRADALQKTKIGPEKYSRNQLQIIE